MTLELLTEKEAEERTAGKGRDDPNMNPTMKAPLRPETSFLWFTAPLRSLRHILWREFKGKICLLIFLAMLFL
uniref:Ferlin C-terminal domain-containing protein n=1 Tax=Sphenodon punctatus TaxID=8508 RepID=A0A8D0L398_SPHPU